jgi:hypothetical protein
MCNVVSKEKSQKVDFCAGMSHFKNCKKKKIQNLSKKKNNIKTT